MTFAAILKLPKNSRRTTIAAPGISAAATTIPVTEASVFYRNGILVTRGGVIAGDNPNQNLTEGFTFTACSAASGPANLTGVTRGVKADGTVGAAHNWIAGTNIGITLSTDIVDQLIDDIDALRGGEIPTIDLTGGQIKFPASQSASADANTLDDYEEGTWTPGISFGGAAVGITYTTQDGLYTKIGRMVTVTAYIYLSSKGSSVGTALITGLPFAAAATARSAVSLRLAQITFANQYMGHTNIGGTTINLHESTEAGVITVLTDADFANNSMIILNAQYSV